MTHTAHQIQLRPIEEADYPHIAELMSMFAPEPISPEQLTRQYQTMHPETIGQHLVALDEQGYLVGFSSTVHDPWMPSGKFFVTIYVDRAKHRQGIGSLLYMTAQQFAEAHGATLLEGTVREDQPEALQFARNRGFTIARHLFESTLDLAQFDETPFQGVIEQVESSGIRFLSLAALGEKLGDISAAQKKLYELTLRYIVDMPGGEEIALPPFEHMRRTLYEMPEFPPDAQMFAIDGENCVGSVMLSYHPANKSMYNAGSGVERAYRGRHIALALKLLAIRCARRYAVAYIRTNNDAENTAMLVLNRRLGYIPEPGMYMMQCKLTKVTEKTSISID